MNAFWIVLASVVLVIYVWAIFLRNINGSPIAIKIIEGFANRVPKRDNGTDWNFIAFFSGVLLMSMVPVGCLLILVGIATNWN